MALLLAQFGGYSLIQLAIFLMVIAGIVGVVFVVIRQAGITIPPFVLTILWIIFAVVLGVVAIKVLSSLL